MNRNKFNSYHCEQNIEKNDFFNSTFQSNAILDTQCIQKNGPNLVTEDHNMECSCLITSNDQSAELDLSKLKVATKAVMPDRLKKFYNFYRMCNTFPDTTVQRPHLIRTDGNLSNSVLLSTLMNEHVKMLFRHLPDKWAFIKENNLFVDSSSYKFQDFAKVRFYCKNCADGWTSMHGLIVFYYQWVEDRGTGQISYQVFGQQCRNCCNGRFELPLWYPEEIQKVITNLYYNVSNTIYGLLTPTFIRSRRYGRPVFKHEDSLCEGCMVDQCVYIDGEKSMENSLDSQFQNLSLNDNGISSVGEHSSTGSEANWYDNNWILYYVPDSVVCPNSYMYGMSTLQPPPYAVYY